MKKLLLTALSAMAISGAVPVQAQNTIDIRGTVWSLDTIYHAKVGPGTTQTHLELVSPSNSKLQVFYLTVDKTTPGVSMRAVCAKDMVAGTERPSAMAKRKSGNGVLYFAGTNGDFYSTSGTATNGTSKIGSPTAGCTADRITYKTSNGIPSSVPGGNFQFSVDVDGVARISRLWYYTGTATLGENVASFLGINVASPNNGITIYTPKYWGSTNQTDKADACAEVTAKLVEGDEMYAGGKFRLEVTSTATTDGDTTIPSDGFVIHGRGTSVKYSANAKALDFVKSLQVGDIVEFDNVVLTEKGSDERIYPAQVVSGNPQNVGGGETLDTEELRGDASSLHPRTGIGISQSGDSIIMMVVDGRSAISAGVRTSQLADIMRYAGAWEAMNLDGGGSSCLYTSALGVRNVGSDGSERSVGNGIFATIEAPDDNEITEVRFVDWVKSLPKYGLYTPKFYGYNKYGVLVDTDLQGVQLSCPAELGEIVDNGTSLLGTGGGTYALTGTYNGLTSTLVVTVDDSTEPYFRCKHVLLDSYNDYESEIISSLDGEELRLDNSLFTWSVDDNTVASVDAAGNIKGLSNGETSVRCKIGSKEMVLPVIVEIPESHYLPLDKSFDISTWSMEHGTAIETSSLSVLGTEGYAVDYTISSSGSGTKTFSIKKDLQTWSRPDSVFVDINPCESTLKSVSLYYEDGEGTQKVSRKSISSITSNAVTRILFPFDKVVDVTDMSCFPITFKRLLLQVGDAAGVSNRIEVPRIQLVYTSVPLSSSGVESVMAQGAEGGLLLSPNPVVSGAVVKMNVSEPVQYTVSALNGAVVKRGEGVELSTAGLTSGVYIVSAKNGGNKSVVKLIVK